jgi:hypothetical protein
VTSLVFDGPGDTELTDMIYSEPAQEI